MSQVVRSIVCDVAVLVLCDGAGVRVMFADEIRRPTSMFGHHKVIWNFRATETLEIEKVIYWLNDEPVVREERVNLMNGDTFEFTHSVSVIHR